MGEQPLVIFINAQHISRRMKKIECIYEKGVLIPLEKLDIPERSRVVLSIKEIKTMDDLKLHGYLRLLREGEDAEELFEL